MANKIPKMIAKETNNPIVLPKELLPLIKTRATKISMREPIKLYAGTNINTRVSMAIAVNLKGFKSNL